MTTTKQAAGNRRNAKKSTGPRAAEGKAIVARNRVTHGLSSRRVVLGDENEAEYAELQHELACELRPEGTVETYLVNRIGATMWRLARCAGIEADLLEKHRRDPFGHDLGLAQGFERAGRWGRDVLGQLRHHEATGERSLYRALHTLKRLQALRSGGSSELFWYPTPGGALPEGSLSLTAPVTLPGSHDGRRS